jgi:hypothetical protein
MAGRKRKSGDRYPSGELKPRNLGPTEYHLARRLAASGDDRTSDVYPLSILMAKGKINQAQHDAGMKLAGVYHRTIGKPHAKNLVIGESQGGGAFDPIGALYDERWIKQVFVALDKLGRNLRIVTLSASVFLQPVNLADKGRLRQLQLGLQAISDLPSASTTEAERDKALAEAAA